ncbi:MAG: hypothetical protein JKY52_19790 [Flavobacteriales bacterium]|nr:hypothetical protein [Flavobacteriales bacterium]
MKNTIYGALAVIMISCGSANKYEPYLTQINSITASSCASGYEYSFSVMDNKVSILYKSPYTEPATYSAALSDLQFSWNTLGGDVEEGIDHEVIIACPNLGDNCLISETGQKSRITIEIKGEAGAESLLSNLGYLKEVASE